MPCVWSGTSCTVSVEPGLPSTGMVLELACLGFAGGRGTSVGGGNGGRGLLFVFSYGFVGWHTGLTVLVSESSGVGVSQLLAGLD